MAFVYAKECNTILEYEHITFYFTYFNSHFCPFFYLAILDVEGSFNVYAQ